MHEGEERWPGWRDSWDQVFGQGYPCFLKLGYDTHMGLPLTHFKLFIRKVCTCR